MVDFLMENWPDKNSDFQQIACVSDFMSEIPLSTLFADLN